MARLRTAFFLCFFVDFGRVGRAWCYASISGGRGLSACGRHALRAALSPPSWSIRAALMGMASIARHVPFTLVAVFSTFSFLKCIFIYRLRSSDAYKGDHESFAKISRSPSHFSGQPCLWFCFGRRVCLARAARGELGVCPSGTYQCVRSRTSRFVLPQPQRAVHPAPSSGCAYGCPWRPCVACRRPSEPFGGGESWHDGRGEGTSLPSGGVARRDGWRALV